MKICFRLLRETGPIQAALAKDGWTLKRKKDNSLIAGHPLVNDESAGRHRLQGLGLLTTSSARIEFIRRGAENAS
jgi:hypothetical protein